MPNKDEFDKTFHYAVEKEKEAAECSNCYIPLREGEVGICETCRHDAGIYTDSIAYNQKTDEMDLRKVKITCPICGREFAALLSKFTKAIRHYYLDSDCEIGAVGFETYCWKCKSNITFRMECC